jgi:hypothetical protein
MKATLTPENLGQKQHLRVELQTLYRLPRSNAIAFDIRCYLGSFDQIVTVPKWARRLHRVIRDLPRGTGDLQGLHPQPARHGGVAVEIRRRRAHLARLVARRLSARWARPPAPGFLMFPGFPMACLTSAIEPLRAANEITGRREFVWRLVAETSAPVRSSAEIGFEPDVDAAELEGVDHLYLLSPPDRANSPTPAAARPACAGWTAPGSRLGAFSGGIFPLARAG